VQAGTFRFRQLERQPEGTIEKVARSQKIASVRDYPQKREVWPLFTEFIARLNKIGFDLGAMEKFEQSIGTVASGSSGSPAVPQLVN
jgi:hypothetical protein